MADDAKTLFKIIVVLGIVVLLAATPGGPPGSTLFPGADAAFNDLRDTIAAGITFPTFNNPFLRTFVSTEHFPTSGGNQTFNAVEAVSGCTLADRWKCVDNRDKNESTYAILNNSKFFFDANYTGSDLAGVNVTSVVTKVWCRSLNPDGGGDDGHGAVRYSITVRWKAPADPGHANLIFGGLCLRSDTYKEEVRSFRAVANMDPSFDTAFSVEFGTCSGCWGVAGVRITQVSMQFYGAINIAAVSGCTGTDFFSNVGCQLARFFELVVAAFAFVIEALVFIGETILAVITFVVSFILALTTAFYAIAVFLFTGTGAPPVIQAMIDIVLVGLLVWVIFLIIKILRPAGEA